MNRHRSAPPCGLALLVLAALVGTGGPVAADVLHGINAGAPVWDGAVILTPAKANLIAATGSDALRINFRLDAGATAWDATQLALYDQVIQNARNSGFDVLGLFSNETVAGGQTAWNDDPDGDGVNSYATAFADTAALLVDRYKDDVKQWEIWNEPNAWSNPNYASDPQNAGGTYILPRVYAEMLSSTYRRLNTAGQTLLDDYGIGLVTGGLLAHDIGGSFSTAMPYMQQVYDRTAVWDSLQADAGRRYPWDDFGYHFYISQGSLVSETYIASYFDNVRTRQAANSDPATVVVTEFGWQTVGTNTEELQRDNMSTAYDFLEAQNYVTGSYWYQWTDDVTGAWGIVDGNGAHKLSYGQFAARNQASQPGPVVYSTEHAELDSGLSAAYSSTDLLEGLIATERPGDLGWHSANPAAGNSLDPNGLPAFTDGVGDLGSGVTGLLNDFPASGAPAKLLEYDLGGPREIDQIRIFTGNDGRDGRIFSTTAVWTSSDGVQFDLLGVFQSDPSGTTNNGQDGATLVTIERSGAGVLAGDVSHLRFDFYAVANLEGQMRDPFDGLNTFSGTDDGLAKAYVSPLVREIDVLGFVLGDMDLDDDADFDDIDEFVFGLSDPAGYDAIFGIPPSAHGDTDRDGDNDFDDIAGFVAALGGGSLAGSVDRVPEPSGGALALLALAGLAASFRRTDRPAGRSSR